MAERGRGSWGIVLIGVFKVLEAALLVLLAAGAHHLLHRDVQETVVHWARVVRVDPDNRYAHALLTRVTGLTPRRIEEISLGTLLYGALFAVEGVGLIFRKRWAEYVAVVSTGGFLPLEVYEVLRRPRWTRVVVLVINALIVVYLVVRLWQERRAGKPESPNQNDERMTNDEEEMTKPEGRR